MLQVRKRGGEKRLTPAGGVSGAVPAPAEQRGHGPQPQPLLPPAQRGRPAPRAGVGRDPAAAPHRRQSLRGGAGQGAVAVVAQLQSLPRRHPSPPHAPHRLPPGLRPRLQQVLSCSCLLFVCSLSSLFVFSLSSLFVFSLCLLFVFSLSSLFVFSLCLLSLSALCLLSLSFLFVFSLCLLCSHPSQRHPSSPHRHGHGGCSAASSVGGMPRCPLSFPSSGLTPLQVPQPATKPANDTVRNRISAFTTRWFRNPLHKAVLQIEDIRRAFPTVPESGIRQKLKVRERESKRQH